MSRPPDYREPDDDGVPTVLVCPDCGRPTLFDYAEFVYHHAYDARIGCALIFAEDRPDDLAHPLAATAEPWRRFQAGQVSGPWRRLGQAA